jgi:hypothetical protein
MAITYEYPRSCERIVTVAYYALVKLSDRQQLQ